MISSIWTIVSFYKEGICYQIEHLEIAENVFQSYDENFLIFQIDYNIL